MGTAQTSNRNNGNNRVQKSPVSMAVISEEINKFKVDIDKSVFKKSDSEKQTLKQMKALYKLN